MMACSQESQPTMNIPAMKTCKTAASHNVLPAKPCKQCAQAYEVGCNNDGFLLAQNVSCYNIIIRGIIQQET
jgi:hypothetical protein